jgi:ATP-binding cassette subfamily B protein
VRDLSFSYETKKDDGGKGKEPRYVLQGVSFEVPPGKSLAIMGRTGAGKSTLAMLLTRLLPTPPTSVFIDGIDVCELPLSSVRGVIGYAQQDAFLFSTTVTRNIAFAMGTAADASGDAALREAAKEAQVLDEVLSLPDKFDTVVGERGVQLSGGQKQRIALARALAWGPRILMLDDPLSAVDAKTEAAILEALDRQAAQRTVVLITHRVAAASRCDQILVLDEGRIVEQGNHSSLMALGGIYTEFAAEQQRARELETLAAEEAPPFDASAASVLALSPGVPS